MLKQVVRLVVLVLCTMAGGDAYGQIARSYLNAPQGNLAMYSYSGVRSNTGGVESLPIPLTETRLQTQSLIYSRIMNIGGRTGGLGCVLPFQDLLSFNTESNAVTARAAGLGDPSITFEANLFGAPALQREEMADWVPGDYCGLHFTFGVPLGDYDPNSAVNLGANRFTFRPLLNYSVTPDEGVSWFDFYSSVAAYSANNSYLGNEVLKQTPLADLELHYSRTVYDRLWAGAGVVGLFGGAVTVNDVVTTPTQSIGRLALSAGTPMFKGSTAIFSYNNTFAHSDGAADSNSYILQLIYLF